MTASAPRGAFLIVPYDSLVPSHLLPQEDAPNATIERLKRAVRDNPTPNRQR